jgi:hypothetical protein
MFGHFLFSQCQKYRSAKEAAKKAAGGQPNPAAAGAGGQPNPAAAGAGGQQNPVAAAAGGQPNPVAAGAGGQPNPVAAGAGGQPNPVAVAAGGQPLAANASPVKDTFYDYMSAYVIENTTHFLGHYRRIGLSLLLSFLFGWLPPPDWLLQLLCYRAPSLPDHNGFVMRGVEMFLNLLQSKDV